MLGAARLSLVPAIIAAWLFLPSTAHAIVPQVHDNGKFFTPETVKKANDLLLRIQEKHKKDVVVETFGEIPEKVLQRINYDSKNRKSFFEQWAKELAKEGKVNGIVILIAKDQNHNNSTWIEVDAGESTQAKSFKSADLTDLHRIFENNWSKDRNVALVEGLQFIDTRMTAHHSTAAAPQQAPRSSSGGSSTVNSDGSGIMGWVCIGLCALLGIWLVVGLVRAFTGGGGYAGGGGGYGPGYGGGYGGGGGGFMSGLMGGLFGAMAGNWIYNNMFGGHSSWGGSTANAGESPAAGGRDDFGPSDQGQGFSGVGGDVDGGGGGDVDGGDGGGGDWGGGGGDTGGGGDWGGGGGDAGGGGGDWGGGGGGDFGGGGGDFGGGGGGGDW